MPGAVEVAGHRFDAAIIHPALDHHIDLDRRQADGGSGGNALQHAINREVHIIHRLEGAIIQRIQTHRYAPQAGILESARLSRQ